MPDLSSAAVHQYWYDYQDKMIYRVIAFLEGVEHWIIDGNPSFEEAVTALGKELDDINRLDLSKLGHEYGFINLSNSVSSGRTLRLLQALDMVHPGSASKLLIHAEETSHAPDDAPGLFLRRNIVFERLRLLGRVFSSERMNIVVKALEGDDNV